MTKHTPIYNITIRQQSLNGQEDTKKLSAPFTRWFDADGCFVAKPFQQWLASEVSLIGDADPKNKTRKIENSNGGVQVAEAVVIQRDETPKKASGNDSTPASTRSRRGKR